MENQYLSPLKHTVHIDVTSKPFFPQLNRPGMPSFAGSHTVRFFCDDVDATDSDSDDSCYGRRRVKRYVHEIRFGERLERPSAGCCVDKRKAVKAASGKRKKKGSALSEKAQLISDVPKFRGVRQRKWGKFAAEIRDPKSRHRFWLGTFNTAEEAAKVYDNAAIKLRGPHATTNFFRPSPADPSLPLSANFSEANLSASNDYESSEDSHNICSPTSVLREFCPPATKDENDKPATSGCIGLPEEIAGEHMLFAEMPLYNDFLDIDAYEPRIFEDAISQLGFFSGESPMAHSGFNLQSHTCPDGDDFFEEISDLFPLDPLPAVTIF